MCCFFNMKELSRVLLALAVLLVAQPSFADSPKLWVDADARISNYHAVYLAPVLTRTGQPVAGEIERDLHQRISAGLASTKLARLETPEKAPGVLVLQVYLMKSDPGNPARMIAGVAPSQSVVRATLVDAVSGELVGDMVASAYAAPGGIIGLLGGNSALTSVADDVAEAIKDRLRAEASQ